MRKYLCICAAALLYVSCSHVEPAPKYPNMVADIDPFPLGSVNASFDKLMSSDVTAGTVDVVFYPRENEVALEFSHQYTQYRQFWNEEGRRLFIEALNRYKEEFANQELLNDYGESRAIYGSCEGRLEWKTLKISATYRSSPDFELGYRFRDDAPYFSAYQKIADEETGANNSITESRPFPIYFTRAQAEELAKLFDEAFLNESLGDKTPAAPSTPGRDEYGGYIEK